MKRLLPTFALALGAAFGPGAEAQNRTFLLSSERTTLAVTTNDGGSAYYQYFGPKIEDGDIAGFFGVRSNFTGHTLPQFGVHSSGQKALAVRMPDGSVSVDLAMESAERTADERGELLTLTFRDRSYPLVVRQCFRRYRDTEVFSTWTELTHAGRKGEMTLLAFASACLPLRRGDNYLTQMQGGWAGENRLGEERLPDGQTVIADRSGLRNAFGANPGFMLTLDGRPRENGGEVFGGNLLWSGNYKTRIVATPHGVEIISGIDEDISSYTLVPGETFVTPEFAMVFSTEGKGGVSRAFHRWARRYGMAHGDRLHDVLLNSWEGVYFGVDQPTMEQMMADMAALGGELFVMDDGWFGHKYPRDNDRAGLGDWTVCRRKLPDGIEGLTAAAERLGIKFGLWIEPEMANTASELFERHPDWVLGEPKRPLSTGRGGTQVVLDLCNPKVQDYVFGIVDDLLVQHPRIAYIKWDCNTDIMNYASPFLPADRQTEIYIRYQTGLRRVLERIRAKHPDVALQLCASGGGRACYGLLPWFDEFWTSDNTDALQRIFIQWGASHFYPAIAQGAHVSASPNHQTGRAIPLKFRFDVAMSGRLGMEIQPRSLSETEKDFARRAIAAYKRVRPVVQLGDQYRLVSPYGGSPLAALMYADENRRRAVVFAYRTGYMAGQALPMLRLDGVDENKIYRIHDLTPLSADKPGYLDGKRVSGRILKHAGLNLAPMLGREYASAALELVAE